MVSVSALLLFMAAVFFVSPVLALTDAGDKPDSNQYINQGFESPFVKVVKEVRDSVVHIACIKDKRYGTSYFYRRNERGIYTGSGFIYKQEQGKVYIITNNHVVEKAKTIDVVLADKSRWAGELVGGDSRTDLAVISIETDNKVKIVALGDSAKISVGAWAIAIGSPFTELGLDWTLNVLDRTVTVGVISGKGRSNMNLGSKTPVYQDYIQTDAPINPGNSGGPLLDIHGRVIGVNTFIINPGAGGNVGIGFAIPSNITKKVVRDLIEHGKVLRAYLGFVPQKIDENLKEALNLDSTNGVLVSRVTSNTPAGKAGLKKGDVITRFDDNKVAGLDRFRVMVADTKIGKDVAIIVLRNGEEKILHATLKENPEDKIAGNINLPISSNWLGVKVSKEENQEVVVIGIEAYSAAEKSNLLRGDIILEINNELIKDWEDYKEISKKLKEEKYVVFYVKRGKKNLYVGIKNF